ncbi:MAG: hypothetical protein V9G12_10255 [Microthrixaceae bacterium]
MGHDEVAEDGSRVEHTKYGDFLVGPNDSPDARDRRAKEEAFGSEAKSEMDFAVDGLKRAVGAAVEFTQSEEMPRGTYLGPTDPDSPSSEGPAPVRPDPDMSSGDERGEPAAIHIPFDVASGDAGAMSAPMAAPTDAFVEGAVDGFKRSNPDASSDEVEAYRAEIASYADGLLHDTDNHTAVGAARSGFQFGTQAGWDAAHPDATDDQRAARESVDLGAAADEAGYVAAGQLTEATLVRYGTGRAGDGLVRRRRGVGVPPATPRRLRRTGRGVPAGSA